MRWFLRAAQREARFSFAPLKHHVEVLVGVNEIERSIGLPITPRGELGAVGVRAAEPLHIVDLPALPAAPCLTCLHGITLRGVTCRAAPSSSRPPLRDC